MAGGKAGDVGFKRGHWRHLNRDNSLIAIALGLGKSLQQN